MFPLLRKDAPLQRLFTRFPSGSAGAVLLLLRATVGIAAMVEAAFAIAGTHSFLIVAVTLPTALLGIALVLGVLTPVAGALLAIGGAGLFVSMPAVSLHLLNSRMALFEYLLMAATLAVVGPGAMSLDAHIFGRREVAIAERLPGDDP